MPPPATATTAILLPRSRAPHHYGRLCRSYTFMRYLPIAFASGLPSPSHSPRRPHTSILYLILLRWWSAFSPIASRHTDDAGTASKPQGLFLLAERRVPRYISAPPYTRVDAAGGDHFITPSARRRQCRRGRFDAGTKMAFSFDGDFRYD